MKRLLFFILLSGILLTPCSRLLQAPSFSEVSAPSLSDGSEEAGVFSFLLPRQYRYRAASCARAARFSPSRAMILGPCIIEVSREQRKGWLRAGGNLPMLGVRLERMPITLCCSYSKFG